MGGTNNLDQVVAQDKNEGKGEVRTPCICPIRVNS